MIKDYKFDPNGTATRRVLDASPSTVASSQTGLRCFAWTAPAPFQIVDVQDYCTSITGSVTFDVKINSTSVLQSQVALTTDTVNTASLVTTVSTLKGKKGDTLSVYYTSGAGVTAVNPSVLVTIRGRPLNGEVG